MKPKDIAAEGIIEVLSGDNSKREINVQVFLPQKDTDSGDSSCRYRLFGEGISLDRCVWGVDTLQALRLAVRALEANLEILNEED